VYIFVNNHIINIFTSVLWY